MPASGLILPRCPPSTVRRRVRCARSDGQVQERMDDVSHTLCVHRCKQHLRRADRRLTPTARRTFSGRRACTQLNPTSSGVPGSAPRGTAGGGAEAAVGDRVARRRCRQEADCGRASVDACRDRLVSVRRSGSLGRYDRFLAAMTYWQSPLRCALSTVRSRRRSARRPRQGRAERHPRHGRRQKRQVAFICAAAWWALAQPLDQSSPRSRSFTPMVGPLTGNVPTPIH